MRLQKIPKIVWIILSGLSVLLLTHKIYKMFSPQFEKVMAQIFKNEGGYVNDPADKGGETNYGISKRAFPLLDIKTLTKDNAKTIYQSLYYDKVGGDSIKDVQLAYQITDHAVNAGVSGSLALLNRSGMDLKKFRAEREKFYQGLIEKNPVYEKYRKSWFNRINKTV